MERWNLISACVAGVGWLAGFAVFARNRSPLPSADREDREASAGLADGDGSVSIIIPARNEAERLPKLLQSIRDQIEPGVEVVVVDDDSTDATADIARDFGARVIPAGELPDGWRGKTNACQRGADASAGERLLFLDADTWFEPGGLRSLLTPHANAAVSVAPFHVVPTVAEQFSAFFNVAMAAGIGAFTLVPREPDGLFGQALLIGRGLYERVGGHAAVRAEILENLHLASRIRAAGGTLECRLGRGALSMRMYPGGMRDIARGWGKAFANGAATVARPILFCIVLWLAGAVSSTALLASERSLAAAVIYAAFALQFFIAFRRLGSFRWYTALLFPIPLMFFFAVFAKSTRSQSTGVEWKGRAVRAG